MSGVWQKFPPSVTVAGLLLALVLGGCQTRDAAPGAEVIEGKADAVAPAPATGIAATPAIDLGASTDLAGLIPRLAERRVIYLGEQHDHYEQHLLQLEIVRRLYERGVPVAIGMEQFQRRFQPVLDDFLAGRIDTREMLRRSEYFQRWRFDYRLYQPILDYARRHGIPVLALNAETELTRRVGEVGLGGLNTTERAALPSDFGPAGATYLARLREVYAAHPMAAAGAAPADGAAFDRFVDVQLSWDETMAETAANYLQAHPERHLVVLVGAGHVIQRHGIPDRVRRRVGLPDAVVLCGEFDGVGPHGADWMLLPLPEELPPAGKMGIMMDDGPQGVQVLDVVADSAAAKAGMQKGDLLRAIGGAAVKTTGDVRVALFGRQPGERVDVAITRAGTEQHLTLNLGTH